MSLTTDDLEAIQQIVDQSIDRRVPEIVQPMLDGLETRLVRRIDELDDALSLQMEHGLQEVRDQVQAVSNRVDRLSDGMDKLGSRLDSVSDKLDKVARQQDAMVDQLDDHGRRLKNLEDRLVPRKLDLARA